MFLRGLAAVENGARPLQACTLWHGHKGASQTSVLMPIRSCGAPCMQDLTATIERFVSELRAGGPEAAHGPQSGAPSSASPAPAPQAAAAAPASASSSSPAAAKGSSASAGKASKPSVPSSGSDSKQTLQIVEKFYARAHDLFECFVVEGRVCAYTQSKATLEPRAGGKLAWFGGSVQVSA